MMAAMKAPVRTLVSFCFASLVSIASLVACGGKIDASPAPSATAATPGSALPSSTPSTPGVPPASSGSEVPIPGIPPVGLESKATRDGKELFLSTCVTTTTDGRTFLYGSVTDLAFEVDAAIISLSFAPPPTRGQLVCVRESASAGPGSVVVVFAESRGAEFVADPEACAFELDDDGSASGVLRGKGRAEYTDGSGQRHSFTLDFAAPPCGR